VLTVVVVIATGFVTGYLMWQTLQAAIEDRQSPTQRETPAPSRSSTTCRTH
jgi:hypothetical protein